MKIVFMGTPEFAVPSLAILLDHGYPISAVVTAPDKPRGRGLEVASTAVKKFADERSIEILQPDSLKDEAFVGRLRDLEPDCIVVVAFRILPREVYAIPKRGAFNLHASLLPKYRGAAPINWAIINGENETGVTSFFLNDKVDTGSVILQSKIAIGDNETAGDLHDRLMALGAETVLATVRLIDQGKAQPQAQDGSLATPAPKIFREQCIIEWRKPARRVHNFIRGLSPSPGASTHHCGKVLKIYRTRVVDESGMGEAGSIITADGSIRVRTSPGLIEIVEIQQEGKRRMPAGEFLKGYRFEKGDRLE